MHRSLSILSCVLAILAAACGGGSRDNSGYRPPPTAAAQAPTSPAATAPPAGAIPPVEGSPVTTPSGLRYIDIAPGSGPTPQVGQRVRVHYTGWLESNGQKFDSSVDRGQPFQFQLGTGAVIKGWDEGVGAMQVGGKRRLIIPPDLAYGPGGRSPIPPNATLVFDVELLGVE